ncbi:ribosomal protein S18 acetylase RimI-like enzyme [Actinoplanes lutulentus]|uniref:Putative GNAT family acetyltransferase n=1 Tax=Actinoplanes lutulentus TaxID=1287878 RepID=A0A327YYQ5_9ACTN|nr:GNAT family N-acetyltransferase [Actinoplanes lutulentus]MBB2943032.1 ribosomal protein S18 acetylase RimI-like enzyme [Actinoplanes lutulentus]RAK26701.1 putative GNAT family acetyltransferase [Actinoplanes lutulentus]
MDLRIQRSVVSNLRTRPKPVEVGPFVAGLDPDTASPFVNYATPQPGATITAADVAALVEAFEQADRKPRLEYVISAAPQLESLLLAAGFTVEARHEYLICTPETLVLSRVPSDFVLEEPGTDGERAGMISAQMEAFGEAPEATEPAVAGVRRAQERGGIALAARTTEGVWAGGGQASAPQDGLSEVGGIAVREAFRRLGLGGTITAGVARLLFERGAEIAWLEAGGEDSWRVYERVGFRPAGKRLYISL